MGHYTSLIAKYTTDLRFNDIPTTVVDRIKLHIIDNLSNIIGGGELLPGRIVQELFNNYGGKDEAFFLNNGTKGPVPMVAYVNSYLSNTLDFDDTYENFAHPGATVIPPAIALAEREQKSGKDLLTGIILGYELSLRIGKSIIPSSERLNHVWGFATWQTFGSVIASAKLLGLNKKQTLDALGIAGMSAPVPSIRKLGLEESERPFTWLKNNYGWSSMAGVIASELARSNFIGNRSILDGSNGFWIMAGSDQCNYYEIEEGLGKEYICVDTSFKPYAACRWSHSAIDAVKMIKRNYEIPLDMIDVINVYTFKEAQRSLSSIKPRNIIDAQFSLPYLVALEINGKSSAMGLRESDLTNEDIINIVKLVKIKVDKTYDIDFIQRREIKAKVEILLKDRKKLSQYVDIPTGDPRKPLTYKQIREKFLNLTERIPLNKRLKILNDIENLEEIDNIKEMVESWYM